MKKETLKKSSEKIYLFISHLAPTSRVKVDTPGNVHIDSLVSALTMDAYRRNWMTLVFFIKSSLIGRVDIRTTLVIT